MKADNTRILQLVEELRAQWPSLSDTELGEMAQDIIDSEDLTEDEMEQIIREVLNHEILDTEESVDAEA